MEILTVKTQINIALAKKDMKVADLYKLLKEKYNKTYTVQNLHSKINRNTLKYSEVLEIADVLNYEIHWVSSEK